MAQVGMTMLVNLLIRSVPRNVITSDINYHMTLNTIHSV